MVTWIIVFFMVNHSSVCWWNLEPFISDQFTCSIYSFNCVNLIEWCRVPHIFISTIFIYNNTQDIFVLKNTLTYNDIYAWVVSFLKILMIAIVEFCYLVPRATSYWEFTVTDFKRYTKYTLCVYCNEGFITI